VNPGKTALALVAIFSLLLSLFAVVRPAIAFDDEPGTAVPGVEQAGNPECPEGTTEIKFEGGYLVEDQELSVVIDGKTVTVTITDVNVAAGTFSFEVEGGLAYVVIAKGGPNGNVYDYRPLGGAAHDDGLSTPINPNNGQPYGISHISFCVVPIVASIDVEKSGPAQSKVGDPADYTVTITNDGDVELFIQDVDDTLAGDLTADAVADCGSLAVDETCVFNYSYTVQADDPDTLVNVVTVTATSGSDGSGMSASDDGTATVNLFQPSIEVAKVADVETALVGDTVTYTVRITNTSSADSPDLDLTAIDDSLEGDLLAECPDLLAAGAYCEFTYGHAVTTEDADPLVNTVSVESNPVGFPNDIDDTATETVDVLMPSVDVEKDGPDLSKATDPAVYTVTITNDGETVIYIESIDDSLQGDLTDAANVDSSDCVASLAIGASCEITYTYIVGEDDLDPLENTVTVVANTAADFAGVEVDDTDTFSVELFQPDIEVTKVGDVTEVAVGDDVTYTVTIENTSSADSPDLEFDLINDSLQGDLLDAANYDSSDCGATLAAGDSCTIVYTRTVLETDVSPLVNTVNVESNPVGFPNDIDDSDEFSVVIEEEAEDGSITVVKEFAECELCETFTRGRYFDGGQFDSEFTEAFPAGITVGDLGTFNSAQDVRDFEHSDPRIEQLLIQYLTLLINIDNCDDLLSHELGDMTVEEIRDAALLILENPENYTADDVSAMIDMVTMINESSQMEEHPLTCGTESSVGTEDFTFNLVGPEGEASQDWGDKVSGETWTELQAGVYTLTESYTGSDDVTCVIGSAVSSTGGTIIEVGDDFVVIDLEEGADITVTVTNECDVNEQPGELGSITIIKNAAPDAAQDFAFTTTGGLSDFSLDDDADATLSNQRTFDDLAPGSYTVTESATAGWTLTSITCSAGGSVNLAGRTATVTISGSENVTCTYVNTRQGEGTQPSGGGPTVTPREGTLAGNPLPNTATTPAPGGSVPAILAALIALGALAVGGQRMAAEARSRR